MGESSVSFPFGVKFSAISHPVAVLDKSFLQGVNSAQLKYYVEKGWTFVVPEVLMFEHFRKRDARRIANIFKLRSIEKNLVILTGIGEMFRAEAGQLKPATTVLQAKFVKLIAERGPSGEFFELDSDAIHSTEERSAEFENKLRDMIEVWRSFNAVPKLQNVSSSELPARIQDLKLQIRDDPEDMRGFYEKHRHASFPPGEMIDENWAFFRWIQVQLLAGLDYFSSYGVDREPNRENLLHELLDLDYLVPALLVGGVACREKRIIDRFRLLRSDGVILK